MFIVIRLIIGIIVFIALTVLAGAMFSNKHKGRFLSTVISIMLLLVLCFIPVENLFYTFDSPEDAYTYFNYGREVELVVSGDESDLVIGSQDGSYTYLIVPKTDDGWKVGLGIDTKRRAKSGSDGTFITIFQYKNTADYFVEVTVIGESVASISDSYDSKFYTLDRQSSLSKSVVTYYAYMPNFDSQYSVEVNGTAFSFDN